MTHNKRPAAPRDLSPAARRVWDDLVAEYRIDDAGGRRILECGLRSLDRALRAEEQISREGETLTDRFGQPRAHPLHATARDCRAAYLAALRALHLAVGAPPKVGRPEGSV